MLGFLFCEQPLICCRCGAGLREGQHVFRTNPDYDDSVMCSGCTWENENEYVMINGNLCASTQDMDDSDFDYGYYEIKKQDDLFCIYRYRHSEETDFMDFYFESGSDSIVMKYDDEGASLLLDGTGRFFDKNKRMEALDWAEWIFSDFSYRMVYEDRRRRIKKTSRVFTPEMARDFYEFCRNRIIGQDAELKKAVYMVIEYAESIAAGNLKNVRNWLLTAPSGSGKTEFYRSVREYFKQKKIDIPVILFDLSQITPPGYNGGDIEDILQIMVQKGSDGKAIVFLDEADKKFIPDIGANGSNYNAQAQSSILSFTEGCEFPVCDKKGKVSRNIDTSKTMFVFMGAFQFIRDNRAEKIKNRKSRVGFGVEEADTAEKEETAFYDNITLDEMIKYGLAEQLAGRISQVINFHRISKDKMRGLIRSKVEQLSYDRNIMMDITDSAVEEFLGLSYTRLGVRAVINRINELVSDVVSEEYFGDGFDEMSDRVLIRSENFAEVLR